MRDACRGSYERPFRIGGVYFHDGFSVEPKRHAPLYWDLECWEKEVRWLSSLGINAIEFATMFEFSRMPSTEMERKKISDRQEVLKLAHSFGMKFGYLLSNTTVSTVPPDEEPSHQGLGRAVELCPQDPAAFAKTMALQEWYMETYAEADFFEEFAADWGGCTCGVCDVSDYLRYVDALARKLATLNPSAKLYADTWCIAYWHEAPMADGWKGVFDREISGSREVIDALPSLPPNVNFALPCHHLYRPLTFESYGGKSATPVFPTALDVAKIHEAGREALAWPHFVMDDDPARASTWGVVHSEVRYIQQLLRSLKAVGMDSVMCNLYLPYLQISNTYAYARLLDDPDTDPLCILTDFAKLIAHPDDVESLARVMFWVENNSYWQVQMPADGRCDNLCFENLGADHLPCDLTRDLALSIASSIRPNESPDLPIPIAAASWLEDLVVSIGRMDWAD